MTPRNRGQGLVEMGLVMGLIAILALGTIWVLAEWGAAKFNEDNAETSVDETEDEFLDLMDTTTPRAN